MPVNWDISRAAIYGTNEYVRSEPRGRGGGINYLPNITTQEFIKKKICKHQKTMCYETLYNLKPCIASFQLN